MHENQNFNTLANQIIHFQHDPQVSEFIFSYTNRSKKLFPYNLLQDKADIIKLSCKFSEAAYNAARTEFYSNLPDSTLRKYLSEEGITLVPLPITSFTSEEILHIRKKWEEHDKKKTFSRVIVLYTYDGPIKEVSPEEL